MKGKEEYTEPCVYIQEFPLIIAFPIFSFALPLARTIHSQQCNATHTTLDTTPKAYVLSRCPGVP